MAKSDFDEIDRRILDLLFTRGLGAKQEEIDRILEITPSERTTSLSFLGSLGLIRLTINSVPVLMKSGRELVEARGHLKFPRISGEFRKFGDKTFLTIIHQLSYSGAKILVKEIEVNSEEQTRTALERFALAYHLPKNQIDYPTVQ
jgi:hypothetical protein